MLYFIMSELMQILVFFGGTFLGVRYLDRALRSKTSETTKTHV